MARINVQNKEITIVNFEYRDYISLTNMANAKESESRASDIIKNRINTRYTLEFLSTWEQINNSQVLKWWNSTTLKCSKFSHQLNTMLNWRPIYSIIIDKHYKIRKEIVLWVQPVMAVFSYLKCIFYKYGMDLVIMKYRIE